MGSSPVTLLELILTPTGLDSPVVQSPINLELGNAVEMILSFFCFVLFCFLFFCFLILRFGSQVHSMPQVVSEVLLTRQALC